MDRQSDRFKTPKMDRPATIGRWTDAAGNALGFCATTAANTVVALPIIAGIFPLIGGGRGRAQRALPFKWTADGH